MKDGDRGGRHKDGLSPRQRKVLKLKESGLTDSQIAKELGIAPATVYSYQRQSDLIRDAREKIERWEK